MINISTVICFFHEKLIKIMSENCEKQQSTCLKAKYTNLKYLILWERNPKNQNFAIFWSYKPENLSIFLIKNVTENEF